MGAGLRLDYMILTSVFVRPAVIIKALFDNGNVWIAQMVLAEFGAGAPSIEKGRAR
jgi:hypothetical protein